MFISIEWDTNYLIYSVYLVPHREHTVCFEVLPPGGEQSSSAIEDTIAGDLQWLVMIVAHPSSGLFSSCEHSLSFSNFAHKSLSIALIFFILGLYVGVILQDV